MWSARRSALSRGLTTGRTSLCMPWAWGPAWTSLTNATRNLSRLFSSRSAMFARPDGGFGGEDAPNRAPCFPDRVADCEVYAAPSRDQPLVYRLSGDTFSLHVDPDFTQAGGFESPIMHGLCIPGIRLPRTHRPAMSRGTRKSALHRMSVQAAALSRNGDQAQRNIRQPSSKSPARKPKLP